MMKKLAFMAFTACVSVAAMPIEQEVVPLPRLQADGTMLRLRTGERFTVIGATDFNICAQWARNRAYAQQVMDQRAALGFNELRVFTAFDIYPGATGGIGRLIPREHADFYGRVLRGCARDAAKRDLYVEFVAFTGPYGSAFPGGAPEMIAHWDALQQLAAEETNVVLELVNEFNNDPNTGIPWEALHRPPPPILASHGSNSGGAEPAKPYWGYITYHPCCGGDWWRESAQKAASHIADAGNVPVVANENARFPDQDSNCDHAFEAAQAAARLIAGSTFHSVRGKNSTLWEGRELECAAEWARGARSVSASAFSSTARMRTNAYPGL